MSDAEMVYVGRRPCGCATSCVVDEPGSKMVADSVAYMIREGMTIERHTTDAVRAGGIVSACPHQVRAPEQGALL